MAGCRWVSVSARTRARARRSLNYLCVLTAHAYMQTPTDTQPDVPIPGVESTPAAMTTYKPPPVTEPPRPRHDVALWAGAAAFCGSLLTIGVFDILNPDKLVEYLGSLIVAAITAGGVYSKERLNAAKKEEGRP